METQTEMLKVLVEKGCYQFPSWSHFPVVAAFSDKTFDMRFEEDLVEPQHARQSFCAALDIPRGDLVCLQQIHSANIVLVTSDVRGRGAARRVDALPSADGAIMREKGIPVGVVTADCAPVFFFDPRSGSAGIAHVGWRGLLAGLPAKMVAAFSNNFLCRAEDLRIAFGPMIRKCCYEVGGDVAGLFNGLVSKRKKKLFLDLTGAIVRALEDMGIQRKHIEDLGFCTHCESELFFSHRREGVSTGRMLSVVMLR